ncbi:host-nuclease inhibitor Gam family protein [Clostridium rectalis]|uniref:host-nuclease inhibitor Gam family protein n=1 Tax=Clostridium rectalis TaxID=2040295 RepID=UPI000F63CA8B|nr:host-nuclease inhibitor Gam family protein [Clostridium rectalis]
MINKLLKNEIDELQEVQGFKVDSLDSANWCFRKIRALQEQVRENKALAEQEKERINAWERKENELAESNIVYFETILTEYYRKLKEENPKAKVNTPYGKISSRKSKKWSYNDKEVIEWAAKNGYDDLIRLKEELDKSTIKKTFKDGIDTNTGEIIPGIEITEEEKITIKVE